MTHRDYMLALFAQYRLGDRAAGVLQLRSAPVEPSSAKDAGAELLGRLNEEARRLGKIARARLGVAGERIDPRLRTWQGLHGRNH